MKKLISIILSFAILTSVGSTVLSVGMAQPAMAAGCGNEKAFLGFPYWYSRLPRNADCTLKSPDTSTNPNALSKFIWQIVLNIIEIALRAIAFIAFGFILFGGFQFISSLGKPDGMAKARTTILNAVIGMVIAIGSVGIVNVVMGIL